MIDPRALARTRLPLLACVLLAACAHEGPLEANGGGDLPLTFYEGPRSAGKPICTTKTSTALSAGQCEILSCDWPNAPTSPTDVTVLADDDGSGSGTSSECDETNNLGTLIGVACESVF